MDISVILELYKSSGPEAQHANTHDTRIYNHTQKTICLRSHVESVGLVRARSVLRLSRSLARDIRQWKCGVGMECCLRVTGIVATAVAVRGRIYTTAAQVAVGRSLCVDCEANGLE